MSLYAKKSNIEVGNRQLALTYFLYFSGFTLDGTVKILDFGLAKIIESASVDSNDVYVMSGETGSLRYMAPGKSVW